MAAQQAFRRIATAPTPTQGGQADLTRLLLAPRAFGDLERLAQFLFATDAHAAIETGELLISGLAILRDHPLVGRKVEQGLRELMIARGRSGYVALYRFDALSDTALVLALRHQREIAGGQG